MLKKKETEYGKQITLDLLKRGKEEEEYEKEEW